MKNPNFTPLKAVCYKCCFNCDNFKIENIQKNYGICERFKVTVDQNNTCQEFSCPLCLGMVNIKFKNE